MKRSCCSLIAIACAVTLVIPLQAEPQRPAQKPKYIIFMLPDGMGLADVTAARIRKNGIGGPPLAFETLANTGYVRTFSAKNTVTDSAASASAYACGEKYVNGELCFHSDGRPHGRSILELAKAKGWSTGLVATVAVTDASPAAFASHVRDRACQQEIARQYIEVSRPDVVLGGGLSHFQATAPDACGAYGDRIAAVKNTGYAVAFTAPELQAQVSAGNSRILGLFSQDALTPEIKRTAGSTEPHLADMTAAALRVLSKNRKGFFLFVEGSQVDLGNHDNDHGYQYAELIAFDSAVHIVLDWINSNPRRKRDTLLVVVPDHETGGFAVGGYGLPSPQFTPEWTGNKHTGSDVIIWSQGPGSEPLRHGIDNTDVYRALKAALE